jgi:tRNA-specific 2-thiouridylase
VIVGSNEELFKDELMADNLNVISEEEKFKSGKVECYAKTRSRDKLHHCEVTVLENGEVKVKFLDDKVRAVTPGQGVVFYDADGKVLGSAFIK